MRFEAGVAGPGQLPLRGERNPGDARPAVARRLADEEQRRVTAGLQIGAQALQRAAAKRAVSTRKGEQDT